MDWMDKLSHWGAAHSAAKDAERLAARHGGREAEQLRAQARTLRERADQLHSELVRPPQGDRPH